MRFCTTCGAAHDDAAPFCQNCGRNLHSTPAPARETLYFSCDGQGSQLLLLYLKTFVLGILTLGIYSFWGRAEIRRYLYSCVKAGEDRFRYHGTGAELFRGWLKAAGIVVILYGSFFLISLADKRFGPALSVLFLYGSLFALGPFVYVGVLRYRMSRTSLRGIHFQSRAQVKELAKIYYKGLFLTLVTLGFYSPWFMSNIAKYIAQTTYYGDQPFDYDGEGGPLFKFYAIWLVLLIPTLYIISIWYFVRQRNYMRSHMTFGEARFQSQMEFWPVVGLLFTNFLLVVFTLGIGTPWARLRWMEYQCETLTLENFAGFGGVAQRVMAATATGESVASLLDMDADLGGGLEM